MRFLRVVRRCIPVAILAFLSFNSFSQVDKEFWFSCPYVNTNHGLNVLVGPQFYAHGGEPIYLRMSTLGNPAVVTISTPANPSGLDTVITIAANSTATVDLTPYRSIVEVSQTVSTIINGAENKGIHIVSSDFITAYYENATIPNPEIFSLKGSNALGTEFYTPFQTHWPNDPLHNYNTQDVHTKYSTTDWTMQSYKLLPDSAFSAFDIVATTDNTVVTITPTTNVVGHVANVPFQVVLNKGQTYSVRQLDQAIAAKAGWAQDTNSLNWVWTQVTSNRKTNNLSGSHVTSNHPIAISVKDDSVFPSEDVSSGVCEDYIGDQIIPVNVIGTEYVVMKGELDTTFKSNGKTITDWLFIVGVKDGTTFTITGSDGSTNNYTIGKGATIDLPVTLDWEHILASDSIYVFHISGYDCEFASAVLPPLNTCTGSNDVGFVRTYGTFNQERFYVNVLVRQGGEKSFTSTDPAASTVSLSSIINAATFTTIPNSAWSITQMPLSKTQLLMGAHELMNTKTYFHLALIYTTAYSWAPYYRDNSTIVHWNENAAAGSDSLPQKQGASYGYFSNFNKIKPKAIISSNNKKVIQVPIGNTVRIVAQGGFQYTWTGFYLNGSVWTPLTSPYYLNKTTGYNPIFSSGGTTGAPVGKYMYKADIQPVCEAEQIDSVFIQVIPPITFNNIVDSLCPDTIGGTTGAGYNLNNLNDSIVGVLGQTLGYGVASWFVKDPAGPVILDDAETNRNVTYANIQGILTNPMANPKIAAPNTSSTVVQLDITGLCTGANGVDIIPNSAMSFSTGSVFNIQVRSYTSDNNYATNQGSDQPVTMILWDGTTKVSVSQNYLAANWKSFSWQNMTFDFSSFTTINNISKITLQFPDPWCNPNTPLQFQFDNLIWNTAAHNQKITNPTSYTIHNKDSVFALITNPAYPNFSDTAKVSFVVSGGKVGKNITLPQQCASQTTCVDLTQYNDQVGGAVIANKVWYEDKALNIAVPDPTCVNVSTSTIYYAQIQDKCTNEGSVSFNISPSAPVKDTSVTVCGDIGGGSASGVILDNYINWVKIAGGITPIWYADAAGTQMLSGAVGQTMTDQQIVYAKVSNGLCDNLAQLKFNVTSIPKITLSPTNVCANAGIETLTPFPTGGVFAGPGVSGVTFDPSVSGVGAIPITYTITVGTCLEIHYDTIQVSAVPTVTTSIIGQASPVVYNTATQLLATVTGGSPTYTYSWTPTATLTNAKIANPTTTNLTVAQTYCVTVTDKNTCKASSCIPVAVNSTPLTIDLSGLKDICLGQTVTLPSPSGGIAPYTISWTATDGFTSAAQSPTDVPTLVGTVTYNVTVTDAAATKITKTATINVNASPKITFANTAPTVCQNTPLTLKPTITGTVAGTTYAWSGAPVVLTPTTTSTEVIDVTQGAGQYPVTLKVDNQNGCSASATALITIDAAPTVKIDSVIGFCVGEPKTINATVTGGTTPYTGVWTGNFNPGDLTPTNIANPVFQSNQYGVYNFTYSVADASGCTASATISNKRLNALPQPKIVSGSAIATCVNTNSTLINSEILNPAFSLNPSQYLYSWTGTDGANAYTSSDSDAIINVSVAKTLNLKLTVTDPHGCSASDSTVVTVNPLPDAQIVANRSVCQGQDLQVSSFINSVANYTYLWTGNAAAYLTPAPTTSPIEIFNSATPSTQYILGLSMTNKTTGCIGLDTIHINVIANPSVVLHDTTICFPGGFTLHPLVSPATGITSSWSLDTTALNGSHNVLHPYFTADSLRDYKLKLGVTTSSGCSASDTMTIHVSPNPTANAGPAKILEASGVQFTLTGSGNGGTPNYTYQWSPAADIQGASTVSNPLATVTSPQTFRLTVTDKNGCKGVDSIFVNVPGQLTVSINATPVCGQQTVTLQAIASGGDGISKNYSYHWYQLPNTTTSIGPDSTLTISVSATSTFEVSVTDAGQTAVSTKILVVNPIPTIAINPNNSPEKVCKGSDLNLSISPTQKHVKYTWSDGSLLTTIDSVYTFMSKTQTGTYDVFVSALDTVTHCLAQQTLTVKVNPLPTVTVSPSNPAICAGNPLIITANSSPNTTFQWFEGTNKTVLSHTNPYTFEKQNEGPYTVSVEVTDLNGCTATTIDSISVGAMPAFKLPDSANACVSVNLPLNINPNNAPNGPSISFIGGATYLVDKTANPPVFKSTTPGNFFVVYKVDDGTGCPRTDTINITVYQVPVLVVPDTLYFCSGSSTPVEIDAQGLNATSYVWSGHVSPTQGPTTYFVLSMNPGTYKVTATAANNNVCQAHAVTTVIVHPHPVVTIPNYYNNVPKGGQVTLTGSASGGTPAYVGQWLPTDNIASVDPTSKGFTATTRPIYFNLEQFTLEVTDANNCTDTTSITVHTINGIQVTVVGDSTNRKADPTHPIDSTTYPKGVLNYKGYDNICLGDSTTLLAQVNTSGSGDYSYQWTLSGQVVDTLAYLVSKPKAAGTYVYTLQLTDNVYKASTTSQFTVYVHGFPTAYIVTNPDATQNKLYVDEQIVLIGKPGGEGPFTSLWTGQGIAKKDTVITSIMSIIPETSIVTYKTTDRNGCSIIAKDTLHILPLGTINISFTDSVCNDGTLSSYQITNADPGTLYFWTITPSNVQFAMNGGDKPGTSKFVQWDNSVPPGVYTITVEALHKQTTTFTVTVLPKITLASNITGPQNVCEHQKASYAISNLPKGSNIEWSIVSGNDKIISPRNLDSINVQWGTFGNENIVVTASNGTACTDNVAYPVTVHKNPVANFAFAPVVETPGDSIYSYKEVKFTNLSYLNNNTEIPQNTGRLNYYWDFIGDGIYVDRDFEPIYSFDQVGIFKTTLIAIDTAWGCRDTVFKNIPVVLNPNCALKYPNVFNPDDSKNAKFTYGFSNGLVDSGYELQIYNRWGQLMWETSNRYDKWDGTFNGAICKQDVYVYHSQATCENGKVIKINGNVTLLR